MARVNITVPDALLDRARAVGLNVSGLATAALVDELNRRSAIAELDALLTEMDQRWGPTSADEQAAARTWADQLPPATGAIDAPRPA